MYGKIDNLRKKNWLRALSKMVDVVLETSLEFSSE